MEENLQVPVPQVAAEPTKETAPTLGPQKISFGVFLLKILAGVFGGAVGSLVLILIFVIGSSILAPFTEATEAADAVSPVFIFITLIMTFLSSTVGNILSSLFLSLTESEKYHRTASTIYQIFIASLIIFLLMAPIYFIAAGVGVNTVVFAVAFHFIISAMISGLILEFISNNKYGLIGVYSMTFSLIVSATVMFGLYGSTGNVAVLLFSSLPIVWGSYAFVYSLFSLIYGWIVDVYDKDFLAADTVYGNDYGKEVITKVVHRAKDEEGSDFLRHN